MNQATIHGFAPVRARAFPELEGSLREYVHEKTGAQLCWLDRPDENKSFAIAFKTVPEDSTGVFHILEHAVLCGSDKYPLRDPFVELLKTSVQTYLNASTYPDKTVYPVSSRNDRDLLNLMDIYLDAVFHPAVYRRPEIFLQEGWRWEGEGEALCLQGVVLNEMKGSLAAPQRVLERELDRLLYPDTCYRFCAGGEPAHIPELSWERLLDCHRSFYHPSNARICLVGSVDLEACLEKLDGFLRDYDRRELCFDIPMQGPLPAQRRTVPYAIGAGEDPAERAVVACAVQLARFDDDLRNNLFSLLCDYLTDDDDAPLKRAVLDAGLAQDFEMDLMDGVQQSVGYWAAWNTDPAEQPALERLVRETLTRLTAQGLDRERLEACFRRFAFELRDRDSGSTPRSLAEALDMLDTWLYGGDPAQGLLAEEALAELEAALQTDAPERLLRELFLDDSHAAVLTLLPSTTLAAEQAAAERALFRAEAARRSAADWARQAEEAEALHRWQQTPDSPEALASIPLLRLSDLAQEPEPLPVTEARLAGTPVLRHRTGGSLAFLRAHFEASDLDLEELPRLALLCELLGCMGTRRYDRGRLPLELMRNLGRLDFRPTILEGRELGHCRVLLTGLLACLPEQAEAAAELLSELLTATVWEDLPLLRDNLRQMALEAGKRLTGAGQRYAITRASARLSARGAANEYKGGLEYLRWLRTVSAADDAALRDLLGELSALARRLVTRERLTLSCNERVSDAALNALLRAVPVSGLPLPPEAAYAMGSARREGAAIPAAVGYAAAAGNLRRRGRAFNGHYPVLCTVLNYLYLWQEIRVRGGAYGCGFSAYGNGDLNCYSYRDPQPGRSLRIFRGAARWLRDYCAGEPDLTGFILGSASALDPLRDAETKLSTAEQRRLRGLSEETVNRWYRELLETTPADLLALAPALEELAEENAVCVVASAPLLEPCGVTQVRMDNE